MEFYPQDALPYLKTSLVSADFLFIVYTINVSGMIGQLSNDQITQILFSQNIGRIACQDRGKLYIVPISYAFSQGYIYGHSFEGQKIKMMRNNPEVCFQVDAIENMRNWCSIIIWGTYEELTDPKDYHTGLKIIDNKLLPFNTSTAVRPEIGQEPNSPGFMEKNKKPIVFRIKIEEQTGRYEKGNPYA